MPSDEVNKLSLTALKLKDETVVYKSAISFELKEKTLPEGSEPLSSWSCNSIRVDDDLRQQLIETIQYVIDRGFDPYDPRLYWSPEPGYSDRVLIPFFQDGKIVGYTGRKIKDGKPKYLTDAQPGYVFNIDNQTADRKFVIVVEGQFDALGIDGVAIMHNEPNATQVTRINGLGKEVIVVPDRDRPGAKMIQTALDNNWSVSLPPWEEHIKDVADAVKHYGRLYTLVTILHYKESNQIKIQLLKKKLENA